MAAAFVLMSTGCDATASEPANTGSSAQSSPPTSVTGSLPSTSTTATPVVSGLATISPLATSPIEPPDTTPVDQVYATPDGSLTFVYPTTWSVTQEPSHHGDVYLIKDASGSERVMLRDKQMGLGNLSVTVGIDSGFRAGVPGVKGPNGEDVELLVQGSPGQSPGNARAVYAISTVGSNEPIGRAAVEAKEGGYYIEFSGSAPLPGNVGDHHGLMRGAKMFSESPEFRETARVMTSLKLNVEKIPRLGCFGFKYKYDKIFGLSCDEAIAVLDRVEKTGTGNGARNLETYDYLCYYSSATALQDGFPEVSCQNKKSSDVSFEARKK